jgi:flagellar hook-associated protein 2
VDGVPGNSSSNTVTGAIGGVTLNLKALTTTTGPVTIDVQPPAVNSSAIVAQVDSFVKLYNSTISAIEKQLNTKPPSNPQSTEELQSGTLFGDSELMGTLDSLRKSMYEPLEGLPSALSSLADIGISTAATSGSQRVSQSSVEGQLQVNTAELENALRTNPSGVEQLLSKWSTGFQAVVNAEALPGGNLEARINGDSEQVAEMKNQISFMNEAIALREKTLQQEYAAMEAAIAHSQAVGNWLTSQIASLTPKSSNSTSL